MKKEGDEVQAGDVVVNARRRHRTAHRRAAQSVFDKRKFEVESNEKLYARQGWPARTPCARRARTSRPPRSNSSRPRSAQDYKTVRRAVRRRDGAPHPLHRRGGRPYNVQLLTMVNLSKVYFETYLPANRLKDVQPGQRVEVRVTDLPGTHVHGPGGIHRAGAWTRPAAECRIEDAHPQRGPFAALGHERVGRARAAPRPVRTPIPSPIRRAVTLPAPSTRGPAGLTNSPVANPAPASTNAAAAPTSPIWAR